MKIKTILITGSQGYIGSCLQKILSKKKYKLYCLDIKKSLIDLNQSNFKKINLLNYKKLRLFVKDINPDLIVHFAGESTIDNINNKSNYINNNVKATNNLLKVIKEVQTKNLIFSSTAAVYGKRNKLIKENSFKNADNIYGKTKLKCEKLIQSSFKSKNSRYIILRFFNVCSSLKNYKVGEVHSPETHLIPIIVNKIVKKKKFKVYGKEFNTADRTCERDYIHIKDICNAILKCIKYLENENKSEVFNLGSGAPMSILKIIKFINKSFPNFRYEYTAKRKGDVDTLACSIYKAKNILRWSPKFSNLKNILFDEIYWQKYLSKYLSNRKFKY